MKLDDFGRPIKTDDMDELEKLRAAARKVIDTAGQYQFFLQGYSQGSASISEVTHAAKENDDAMNELQSLITTS